MNARAAVLDLAATLPEDSDKALLVGRLWQPGVGPVVVAYHAGALHDLSRLAATTSQLFELDDPAAAVRAAVVEKSKCVTAFRAEAPFEVWPPR